ncbi:MAG: hypothetical protein ACLFWF_07535 [Alphaproteobacteria bacterium]
MKGKTVGIYGWTRQNPPERDSPAARPEEPVALSYDPLEYEVSCFRNGPPEFSPDEEVSREISQFMDFIGQMEGVTVSERAGK